jgi:hypothetical protein
MEHWSWKMANAERALFFNKDKERCFLCLMGLRSLANMKDLGIYGSWKRGRWYLSLGFAIYGSCEVRNWDLRAWEDRKHCSLYFYCSLNCIKIKFRFANWFQTNGWVHKLWSEVCLFYKWFFEHSYCVGKVFPSLSTTNCHKKPYKLGEILL